MIWALLAIWLFGGGGDSIRPFSMSLNQAESLVKQHVPDKARRAKALDILEQMTAVEAERGKSLADYRARMQTLVDDQTSPVDRFSAMITAERAKAFAFQERMLDLRFELKSHMTAAEWSQVFTSTATAR